MSIELTKKAEKVGILLTKKGITNAPTMRVGLAIDVSGSMDMGKTPLYSSGILQEAFNQMMGVAVKFDDNGELDVFEFNNSCRYIGTCNPAEHANYIKKHIRIGGGTNYGPIVESAGDFFFKGAKKETKSGGFLGFGKKTIVETTGPVDNTPVLMIVLTDGEPSDAGQTLRLLEAHKSDNIYWHFVGINGNRGSFPTIAHLADALPNVGEVYLPRLDMSDDEIYEQLICDELVAWVRGFEQKTATA